MWRDVAPGTSAMEGSQASGPATGGAAGPGTPVAPASTGAHPTAGSAPAPADAGAVHAVGPSPAGPVPTAAGRHTRLRDGRQPGRSRWLVELVVVLVLGVAAAVVLRAFVVQTFYIPSGSMEPTLMIGDRILVDKLSYHFHPVHRGDIVVFARPPGELAGPNVKDLVKRVIGLPGDTVSGQGGKVEIDGRPLAEPWLPPGTQTQPFPPVTVPPGEYFVMGDNRGDSSDSRVFGPIPGRLIVGHVVLRFWPLSRLGFL